uniref:Glucose-6-phosphate isomerase n=1 Tax=Araucaria cunninghamii TaxID=56994 RepID=A0A0D6QTZ8_ARACU
MMAQNPLCLKFREGTSTAWSRWAFIVPENSCPNTRIIKRVGLNVKRCRLATRTRANAVAREVSSPEFAQAGSTPPLKKKGLETDPAALWNRYLEWLYQHKELGLYVDVSRIGFTDEFVEEMEPKFQRAFKAMQELEAGAIANPDEGRMVGHYWLRKSTIAPNSILQRQIDKTLDRICKFADEVITGKIKPPSSPTGRFTQVLSVGIGGSALGPEFVAEALAPDNPPLKIRFIDNTDPAGIDHQIAQLGSELASTLVIVISKSGGTPETRNGLLEVQKAFREMGLDFSKQGVAITQEGSLLDNTARIEGWVARFPMFDWVGGRTSEMSAVGLLPAALQGNAFWCIHNGRSHKSSCG